MIELKKITLTSGNMKECIALDVTPEKLEKEYIYSNAIILALAYDYNSQGNKMECYAVYAEGKMVGLVSYNYYVNDPVFTEVCYRLRPVMIDINHQGKGYEQAALKKLLDIVKAKPDGPATAIFASYHPSEQDMAKLYESAKFIKTDKTFGAENPDNPSIITKIAI